MTVGIMIRLPVSPVTSTEANHSTSPVTNTCFQLGTPAGRCDGPTLGCVAVAAIHGPPTCHRLLCVERRLYPSVQATTCAYPRGDPIGEDDLVGECALDFVEVLAA